MIRVLLVVRSLAPSGAEHIATHLACSLDRARFLPQIVSFANPTGSKLETMLAKNFVQVEYLGKKPGFQPSCCWRILRVIRHFRPDVVHTHSTVLPYLMALTLCRSPPATLHTVHSLADKETFGMGRRLQALAFRNGVVPVAIARQVAASILRVYGINGVAVIPNGITVPSFTIAAAERPRMRSELGAASKDTVFAFVGRLENVKAPHVLLRAFSTELSKEPSAMLWFIGDGSQRLPLEHQAEKAGLLDRIRFLGGRDDVPALLAAADIFVMPSHYEGAPLALMEAMAAGKPVIASDVGGIPELMVTGLHGLLVRPADQVSLSKAMRILLLDSDLREQMGLAAAKHAVRHFDATTMVHAYEQVYERLVTRSIGRVAGC